MKMQLFSENINKTHKMDFKNKLSLKEFEVSSASCSNLAGNYHGEKKTFDVKQMSSSLSIKIISLNKLDLGGIIL